ncbi:MAG: ankyrin repeat domain-containing protein [Weeksellaceae bacterium]
MKLFYIFCITFLSLSLYAQENVFLERNYWQNNPTLEQVKADIAKGNDPTQLNENMFDASTWAILNKAHIEVIKYLVSLEGNGVNKITHDGRNYLMWAGYAGDIQVIEWLIAQGSDVNHKDEHGYGLVTFTAVGGQMNPEIYDLYLSKGVSLDETNRDGANALLLASKNATSLNDLSYFLDHGMSLLDEDEHGNNIFLYAVSMGNISFLKDLKGARVDYRKVNKDGENAVLVAAQGARRHHNSVDTFVYLNELDVDFNLKNKEGKTALHEAAANNPEKEVIEYLIKMGNQPNTKDKDGNPAIFYAVAQNNKTAITVLSQYIQNLDYQNNASETLMSYAIKGNNEDFTAFLLEKDINLSHLNDRNESYINLLFTNYSDRNKDYFDKYIQVFTQKDILPAVNSENGNTILHTAIDKDNIYLINKAMELTKNINVSNNKGLTPLQHAALMVKDVEILKKLVEAGADKTVQTEFDETVYQLAAENEALKGQNITFLK